MPRLAGNSYIALVWFNVSCVTCPAAANSLLIRSVVLPSVRQLFLIVKRRNSYSSRSRRRVYFSQFQCLRSLKSRSQYNLAKLALSLLMAGELSFCPFGPDIHRGEDMTNLFGISLLIYKYGPCVFMCTFVCSKFVPVGYRKLNRSLAVEWEAGIWPELSLDNIDPNGSVTLGLAVLWSTIVRVDSCLERAVVFASVPADLTAVYFGLDRPVT